MFHHLHSPLLFSTMHWSTKSSPRLTTWSEGSTRNCWASWTVKISKGELTRDIRMCWTEKNAFTRKSWELSSGTLSPVTSSPAVLDTKMGNIVILSSTILSFCKNAPLTHPDVSCCRNQSSKHLKMTFLTFLLFLLHLAKMTFSIVFLTICKYHLSYCPCHNL